MSIGIATIAVLGLLARSVENYWANFAQNTAADLIGGIFIIFVLTPIIERASQSAVQEHDRLDYSWFLERAARSHEVLRVVDTFSNLLIEPYATEFNRVVRNAVDRGVAVKILLINPTTLAAEQRDLELGAADDLQRKLELNLRALRELRRSLGAYESAANDSRGADFQVRLYSSGPDVTMYRCDERCLISFYTVGKVSGDSAQLEVSAQSPLGSFVNNRFHAVWSRAAPYESLLSVVLRSGDLERTYLVKSVEVDGVRYVTSSRISWFLRQSAGRTVTATLSDGSTCVVEPIDDEPELSTLLDAVMLRAYHDTSDTPFLRLAPTRP